MIIIYSCIGVVVLGIIVSILRTIDWYSVFAKRYGNNPLKAKVYVDFGENEVFYDGWYVGNDDKWFYYDYEIDKHTYTALMPIGWLKYFIFVRGRVKICVDFGNEYAKPLVAGHVYPADMGAETLNEAINKRLALEMVKSVKSRKGVNMGLIIVVVVIAIGLFLFWRSQSSKPDELPGGIPGQVSPTTAPAWMDNTDNELNELMGGE